MLLLTIFVVVLWLFLWRFTHWKRLGISGPMPVLPIGNIWSIIRGENQFFFYFNTLYDKYKDHSVIGVYAFLSPILVVKDVDLINRIMGADLDYWNSHGINVDIKFDPMNAHLFAASGDYWKRLRNKLNPLFTPARVKGVYPFMKNSSDNLVKHIEQQSLKKNELNVKDVLFRYTIDVIGEASFGFNCKSFSDDVSPYLHYVKRISENSLLETFRTAFHMFMPELATLTGIYLTKPDVRSFFEKVAIEAIEYRESNHVKRDDILDLLIGLKNDTLLDDLGNPIELGVNGKLTEVEVIAQVYMFYFAGSETSTVTASFALLMLARHPEIQERARDEIVQVLKKHNGEFSYEALAEMNMLANIINEIFRLFPPAASLFRKCTKDYYLPDTNATIKKDTMMFMPIYAIQRDPRFFENPNKFDPDRFSPERRTNILAKTLLTYGQGPRVCIGIRFGTLLTKLALARILNDFEVVSPESSMCGEITFDPYSITTFPKNGIHLQFKKLETE